MNDTTTEQEIQAKGLTAPRVTMDDIESEIASEAYFTAHEGDLGAYHEHQGVHQGTMPDELKTTALSLLTICVLVLKNGFTVTGKSACASPENYDEALGRQIARQHAIDEIWPLLGFRLKDQLHARSDIGSVEKRARLAHEINRAYCEAIGDTSQVPWSEAPKWQQDSAIKGVLAADAGATPEQLHESWMKEKRVAGWVYGPVKDGADKTHPCLVPYDQLPKEQRVKDHLFAAAVRIL